MRAALFRWAYQMSRLVKPTPFEDMESKPMINWVLGVLIMPNEEIVTATAALYPGRHPARQCDHFCQHIQDSQQGPGNLVRPHTSDTDDRYSTEQGNPAVAHHVPMYQGYTRQRNGVSRAGNPAGTVKLKERRWNIVSLRAG